MSTPKITLDKSLHLRVSNHFEQRLSKIAIQNGLKTSSLARFILTKHLHEFSSETPLWMR